MNNSIRKFLNFNGTNIYFVQNDGQYWVAIKPICTALGVTYERQRERIKQDAILSELPLDQGVVAADNKVRKMVCLPEKYIYGWIFSIQSKSPALLKYKKECYNVLFDYFNGTITKLRRTLNDRTLLKSEIDEIEKRLLENQDYQELQEKKKLFTASNRSVKKVHENILNNQGELNFPSN